MFSVPSSRGTKRKSPTDILVFDHPSRSSKAIFLSPSLLLLEIPADIDTSLPVWEAMRSQQLDIDWTVNPYGVSVLLTPVTSHKRNSANSSKSESTSYVVETSSEPSSSILQPQMVVQSLGQQHGSPKNTCVRLTLSQNSAQSLPQKTPPNPPSASFIIPLPLIITQPSTPTKKEVLTAIRTPTATPTELRAPSKLPVPSLFHTKSSSHVKICDKFLLNSCLAGQKCGMHHTPYPFHWQLRCAITRKWISVRPRCQVLLERIYCNVNRGVVCIKDGNVHQSLTFDHMKLSNPSKYDMVRRLTNSDSWLRNPYFPSKCKIYWWKSCSWEEYNTDVSTLLLEKIREMASECSFTINSQEYNVDFGVMIQTNVATGFKRAVRCRPVYQSPDSMQPYLQTGVQIDPTKPDDDPPEGNFKVDPLEEFSSWYPPVWGLDLEQDYSLVDVPAGTQAYRSVHNLFYETMSEVEVDIVSIQQVQNLLHWDKYQRQMVYMQKQHNWLREPLERHLFHGTTKDASEDICRNNFDPRMAGVNGVSFGFGSYFARTASFSKAYAAKIAPDKVYHTFLAKVLVGKTCVGKSLYRRPPPLNSNTKQYHLYDSCVENIKKPTIFVVFDSCQCYPYYLIKYRDLPREVEI